MKVSVVTPDTSHYDGDATQVVLPAWDGEMGILGGHAPLIARLGHGVARIHEGATTHRIAVYGGFVKVQQDVVTVLAGGAATPEGGDRERARKDYDAAQQELSETKARSDVKAADIAAAEEKVLRARAYHDLLQHA